MPRALVTEWKDVAESERAEALERWRAERIQLEADGCHYWVYESQSQRGHFIVFTEARDAGTLRAARARAGIAAADDVILHEVELR